MKKFLIAVAFCFVFGGCSLYNEVELTKEPLPTQEITPTKIIEQELISTPFPTETSSLVLTAKPEPTSTPRTTPTPITTPTSKHTETPKPTATPKPEPTLTTDVIVMEINISPSLEYSFSGKGDDVLTDVYIERGRFVKFTCMDDGHKSLKVYFGDDYDLLVNSTEPYEGTTFLHIEYDTDVMFEVNADEEWVLEIYDFGFCTKDDFNGTGDYVSPLFMPTSNVYEINSKFDGHFAVKGYYGDFEYDLLVNETDPYSGKVLFKPEEEVAFFVVTADGEWSINPVK